MVCCEGGDQVGKADMILALSERLLSEGNLVTYSSFPIYASPWGAVVRYSLKSGLGDFSFDSLSDELKTRMSFFALNRLEFMEILLSNPRYKDTIILLDRSPFSLAVTIGYGLANEDGVNEREKVNELIDYALDLEKFMIKKMNLKNCVVQLSSKNRDWEHIRSEKGDIFERKGVQDGAEEVYHLYADRIGEGWKNVITKTESGWRPREEISDEVYTFLISRLGELGGQNNTGMYKVRYEIGIEEILGSIYQGQELPSGILTKYLKALRENEKDLMYKYAYEIGVKTGESCQVVRFKNKGVRKAIRGIMERDPKILEIASKVLTPGFVDKFSRAVGE